MPRAQLSPGPLFRESGLHTPYLPVSRTASPDQIRRQVARSPDLGGDMSWPADSPVAEVYDVTNTSAKMILLNNESRKRPGSSGSHLRAHSAARSRTSTPDPARHSPQHSPRKNQARHGDCLDSSSPYFYKYQKVVARIEQKSAKGSKKKDHSHPSPNSSRHINCSTSKEIAMASSRKQPKSGVQSKVKKPISANDNYYLVHPDLSTGNKKYMWYLARCYDMSDMKKLEQLKYRDILMRQQYLGFHSDEEYTKYMNYIEGPRKKQYGGSESMSKSGNRSSKERPKSCHPRSKSPSKHEERQALKRPKSSNPRMLRDSEDSDRHSQHSSDTSDTTMSNGARPKSSRHRANDDHASTSSHSRSKSRSRSESRQESKHESGSMSESSQHPSESKSESRHPNETKSKSKSRTRDSKSKTRKKDGKKKKEKENDGRIAESAASRMLRIYSEAKARNESPPIPIETRSRSTTPRGPSPTKKAQLKPLSQKRSTTDKDEPEKKKTRTEQNDTEQENEDDRKRKHHKAKGPPESTSDTQETKKAQETRYEPTRPKSSKPAYQRRIGKSPYLASPREEALQNYDPKPKPRPRSSKPKEKNEKERENTHEVHAQTTKDHDNEADKDHEKTRADDPNKPQNEQSSVPPSKEETKPVVADFPGASLHPERIEQKSTTDTVLEQKEDTPAEIEENDNPQVEATASDDQDKTKEKQEITEETKEMDIQETSSTAEADEDVQTNEYGNGSLKSEDSKPKGSFLAIITQEEKISDTDTDFDEQKAKQYDKINNNESMEENEPSKTTQNTDKDVKRKTRKTSTESKEEESQEYETKHESALTKDASEEVVSDIELDDEPKKQKDPALHVDVNVTQVENDMETNQDADDQMESDVNGINKEEATVVDVDKTKDMSADSIKESDLTITREEDLDFHSADEEVKIIEEQNMTGDDPIDGRGSQLSIRSASSGGSSFENESREIPSVEGTTRPKSRLGNRQRTAPVKVEEEQDDGFDAECDQTIAVIVEVDEKDNDDNNAVEPNETAADKDAPPVVDTHSENRDVPAQTSEVPNNNHPHITVLVKNESVLDLPDNIIVEKNEPECNDIAQVEKRKDSESTLIGEQEQKKNEASIEAKSKDEGKAESSDEEEYFGNCFQEENENKESNSAKEDGKPKSKDNDGDLLKDTPKSGEKEKVEEKHENKVIGEPKDQPNAADAQEPAVSVKTGNHDDHQQDRNEAFVNVARKDDGKAESSEKSQSDAVKEQTETKDESDVLKNTPTCVEKEDNVEKSKDENNAQNSKTEPKDEDGDLLKDNQKSVKEEKVEENIDEKNVASEPKDQPNAADVQQPAVSVATENHDHQQDRNDASVNVARKDDGKAESSDKEEYFGNWFEEESDKINEKSQSDAVKEQKESKDDSDVLKNTPTCVEKEDNVEKSNDENNAHNSKTEHKDEDGDLLKDTPKSVKKEKVEEKHEIQVTGEPKDQPNAADAQEPAVSVKTGNYDDHQQDRNVASVNVARKDDGKAESSEKSQSDAVKEQTETTDDSDVLTDTPTCVEKEDNIEKSNDENNAHPNASDAQEPSVALKTENQSDRNDVPGNAKSKSEEKAQSSDEEEYFGNWFEEESDKINVAGKTDGKTEPKDEDGDLRKDNPKAVKEEKVEENIDEKDVASEPKDQPNAADVQEPAVSVKTENQTEHQQDRNDASINAVRKDDEKAEEESDKINEKSQSVATKKDGKIEDDSDVLKDPPKSVKTEEKVEEKNDENEVVDEPKDQPNKTDAQEQSVSVSIKNKSEPQHSGNDALVNAISKDEGTAESSDEEYFGNWFEDENDKINEKRQSESVKDEMETKDEDGDVLKDIPKSVEKEGKVEEQNYERNVVSEPKDQPNTTDVQKQAVDMKTVSKHEKKGCTECSDEEEYFGNCFEEEGNTRNEKRQSFSDENKTETKDDGDLTHDVLKSVEKGDNVDDKNGASSSTTKERVQSIDEYIELIISNAMEQVRAKLELEAGQENLYLERKVEGTDTAINGGNEDSDSINKTQSALHKSNSIRNATQGNNEDSDGDAYSLQDIDDAMTSIPEPQILDNDTSNNTNSIPHSDTIKQSETHEKSYIHNNVSESATVQESGSGYKNKQKPRDEISDQTLKERGKEIGVYKNMTSEAFNEVEEVDMRPEQIQT